MFGRTSARVVQDPGWNQWAQGGDAPGAALFAAEHATRLLTVYGCVTRIADVMATMPVDHLTKSSAGVRTEVSRRAAWLDMPNRDTDWSTFMVQVMWSWLLDGNVFIAPTRNTAGQVVELWILDPTRVRIYRRMPGAPLTVELDGAPFLGELLHMPAYLPPGEVRGVNPIENARIALSLGLNAQSYGAGFFSNSAVPSVLLIAKQGMNEEQAEKLGAAWKNKHAGKPGGVGVVTGDVDLKQLTIAPEQAQFLETQRFSAASIAANLFHVPPDMVGVALEGSTLTYQNMETRWTEFVRSACQPWMTRFEKAVSLHLLPRPQFIKFSPDVYLRADTKTRYETHAIGITGGFLLDDEARALEDLPPLTDEERDRLKPAPPPTAPPTEEGDA